MLAGELQCRASVASRSGQEVKVVSIITMIHWRRSSKVIMQMPKGRPRALTAGSAVNSQSYFTDEHGRSFSFSTLQDS
jgi:hypothetical protein